MFEKIYNLKFNRTIGSSEIVTIQKKMEYQNTIPQPVPNLILPYNSDQVSNPDWMRGNQQAFAQNMSNPQYTIETDIPCGIDLKTKSVTFHEDHQGDVGKGNIDINCNQHAGLKEEAIYDEVDFRNKRKSYDISNQLRKASMYLRKLLLITIYNLRVN